MEVLPFPSFSLSIVMPRMKYIKKWEKASNRRYYSRLEKKNITLQFSTNPKACIEWRDTAISILEEADRNMWKDVEDCEDDEDDDEDQEDEDQEE